MTESSNPMSEKPLAVLVLDGESGQALKAVRCLAADDRIRIHVVSRDEHAPVKLSRHVHSFHYHSNLNTDESYLDFLEALIQQKKIDLLFPILEDSVYMLTLNRRLFEQHCKLAPLPEPGSFTIATDKRQLGEFMRQHSIPAPQTLVFESTEGNLATINSLQYPVLAKPGRGGFGRNIHQFDSSEELLAFVVDPKIDSGTFAVQPFIDGSDIDCSVLCVDGRIVAHTIQQSLGARREFGPPTAIEFVENPEVLEIVRQLMHLLDWTGVAHVDLRRDTAGRYFVLEINARYWGSLLGSMTAGVNFPVMACRVAMGEEPGSFTVRTERYGVGPLGYRARRAQARAGIPLSNTRFPYIVRDPLPDLVEKASLIKDTVLSRFGSATRKP